MGQFEYHLDNIYNCRWQRFYFADGTFRDSRDIHWLQLEWEKVVKLEAVIRGFVHTFLPGPNHMGFITYRSSGIEWVFDGKAKPTPRGLRSWHLGYLDKTHAHVTEINFQTGLEKGREVIPIKKVESNIHPRLKQIWARDWNPQAKDGRDRHLIADQGHL